MKWQDDYIKSLEHERLNFSQNDLGIQLDNYNADMFASFARASGDDENPEGELILRTYQKKMGWSIMQAVLTQTKMDFYIEQPRQSGKTTMLTQVPSQLAAIPPSLMAHKYPHLKNGVRVGIYGPEVGKARKVRDKIETVLSSRIYRDVLGVSFDRANAVQIILSPSKSSILCGTASDTAKCPEQPSFHIILIEEAQAISSMRIIKSLRPMLAATNGVMVFIGTASHDPKEHGLFYDTIRDAEEHKKKTGHLPPGVFIVSIEEVFAEPGTQRYRKFVLSEIKKWGVSHPAIQSQFFNRWDCDIGLTFVRPEWLYRLRKTETKGMTRRWFEHDVFAGIDVAKVRDDTVVEIFQPPYSVKMDDKITKYPGQVRGWLWLQGDNYAKQATDIRRFLAHYHIIGGYCDTRGPGRVLLDYIHEDKDDGSQSFPQIDPHEPTDDEISDEWMSEKVAIINGEWVYPRDDIPERHEFERQWRELIKVKTTSGKMRIDHPKRENGKSDFPCAHRYARKASEGYEPIRRVDSNSEFSVKQVA